jgi:acyl carrier protein
MIETLTTTEREVAAIVGAITKSPLEMIQPDTDLRTQLNVDSLQGLQIVAAIERRFGVTVPDEEIDLYSNVRAIAETVDRLRGGK